MLSPQYQKDIKNQSLFNKGSTYFFRKQIPVSEKLTSEIDIHIMKKAKVLPRPQVFAIRIFILENLFEYSQLLDPICSQPPTREQIEKELDETRKEAEQEVDEQIRQLEAEVDRNRQEKATARESDDEGEVHQTRRKRKIRSISDDE